VSKFKTISSRVWWNATIFNILLYRTCVEMFIATVNEKRISV